MTSTMPFKFVSCRLPDICAMCDKDSMPKLLDRLSGIAGDSANNQSAFVLKMAEVAAQFNQNLVMTEWFLKLVMSRLKPKSRNQGSLTQEDTLVLCYLQILVAIGPGLKFHQQILQKIVLPIATQKQQHNASTLQTRIVATVLLCLCAQHLQGEEKLLQRSLACCQDIDAEIRAYMAGQISNLISAFESDTPAIKSIITEVMLFIISKIYVYIFLI